VIGVLIVGRFYFILFKKKEEEEETWFRAIPSENASRSSLSLFVTAWLG
jgi:hypothetical protein